MTLSSVTVSLEKARANKLLRREKYNLIISQSENVIVLPISSILPVISPAWYQPIHMQCLVTCFNGDSLVEV